MNEEAVKLQQEIKDVVDKMNWMQDRHEKLCDAFDLGLMGLPREAKNGKDVRGNSQKAHVEELGQEMNRMVGKINSMQDRHEELCDAFSLALQFLPKEAKQLDERGDLIPH